ACSRGRPAGRTRPGPADGDGRLPRGGGRPHRSHDRRVQPLSGPQRERPQQTLNRLRSVPRLLRTMARTPPWSERFRPLTDQIQDAARAWANKQTAAEGLIPLVGRLYREHDVLLTVYGRSLLNKSVTGII